MGNSFPGGFWKYLYIIILQKQLCVYIMYSAKVNKYDIMIN